VHAQIAARQTLRPYVSFPGTHGSCARPFLKQRPAGSRHHRPERHWRRNGGDILFGAVTTFDLDIFVLFEGTPIILTLSPIYEFLKSRGHAAEPDAIMIHGWPVQFLPAETPLLRDAVNEARE